MSSAERAARALRGLELEDWSVLHAMERALSAHEATPVGYLIKATKLHEDEVEFRLKRLNEREFITGSSRGYILVSAGLDAVALNAFVKRDRISGMGKPIGMGKESDVFEAISEQGELYAVKFYRIGRTSFRATRKKRAYVSPLHQHHWLLVNIQAAKTEYGALRRLYPLGVAVPEAVARERHAILMRKIEGRRLSEWASLDRPAGVLKEILRNIGLAYRAGFVNSDLSEYNVLYDGEGVWIIDWPQALGRSHPNSSALLDRDVSNILRFFRRRFNVRCRPGSALSYAKGLGEGLEILE